MAVHNHNPLKAPTKPCKACWEEMIHNIDKAPLRPSPPLLISKESYAQLMQDMAEWQQSPEGVQSSEEVMRLLGLKEEPLPLAPGISCQKCGNTTAYGLEPDDVYCAECKTKIVLPEFIFPDVSNT
jgi:hypothetical protein